MVQRTPVCVVGATGRMGQRVVRLLADHPTLVLGAALERPGHGGGDAAAAAGLPAAGVRLTDDIAAALATVRVLIDFSAPAQARALAPACAARGVGHLVASTGLVDADHAAIDAAAASTAMLQAANLSLGVNVLQEAVELVARRLGSGFDVEVSEMHHRYKKDAPSGTALALGAAARRGRAELREVMSRSADGKARAADELGYAVLRGGDVPGEHTVYFFGEGERVELTHRAATADIFARGALIAAAWLAGRKAGRYTMRDVLAG